MYLTRIQYDEWEEATMAKHSEKVWLRNIYWKLDEISCVLVLRNKFWFNSTKHILKDVWESIEKERISGHQHRAPNTRKKNDYVKERTCNIILNDGVTTIVNNNTIEKITSIEKVIPEPIKKNIILEEKQTPPRKPSITIDI